MLHLYGTYRGFFPSDESELGFGEAQIVFDAEGIVLSCATGLETEVTTFTSDELSHSTTRVTLDVDDVVICHTYTAADSPLGFDFVPTDDRSSWGIVVDTVAGPACFVRDMTDEVFDRAASSLAREEGCSIDDLPRLNNNRQVATLT